jgi:hypothetical protein
MTMPSDARGMPSPQAKVRGLSVSFVDRERTAPPREQPRALDVA